MNETTGKLKVKMETQRVSDKFQKREFVITQGDTYPQHITFQLTQDKCDLIDKYKEGDEIKVAFNLRGREWNGPQGIKYFNTIEAWKIELVSEGTPSAEPKFTVSNESNDDLPF